MMKIADFSIINFFKKKKSKLENQIGYYWIFKISENLNLSSFLFPVLTYKFNHSKVSVSLDFTYVSYQPKHLEYKTLRNS